MKKYSVGIIGYGWVATAHIPAINATTQGQVTAVCSNRSLDPAELTRKYGGTIKAYSDYDAMLADRSIDAISVCSYPWMHADHVIKAARAGKQIIIEKPLALSWKECVAMRDAVQKARVRTCVCFEVRYSAQFLATRALLESGLLGEIHYGEVDYFHGIGPWFGQYRWNIKKDGGGSSLLSAGCHALDALLLCMGGDVVEVQSLATGSQSEHFQSYEYKTTQVNLLRFKDGRVGKCASVIDCLQPYYFHTHLVGSEGSLLDNKWHSQKLKGLNKNQWSELSFSPVDSGDVKDHPYQTQFQAFFDALDRNEEMPLTSLADALRSHAVIFAADESAKRGKPVKI